MRRIVRSARSPLPIGARPGASQRRIAGRNALGRLLPLRLRLVQPEAHTRLAVNRGCDAKVLLRLMVFGGTPEELAEAEVAVGNQGPHTARLGERQCLAVVGFSA